MPLIQDPAQAYRQARQLLSGSPFLDIPARTILLNEIYAYTDALEQALALVKTQLSQGHALARILALAAVEQPDGVLRIEKGDQSRHINVDIADSPEEFIVTASEGEMPHAEDPPKLH